MLKDLKLEKGFLCFEDERDSYKINLNQINMISVSHATVVISLSYFDEVHILTEEGGEPEFSAIAKILSTDERFMQINKRLFNLENVKDVYLGKELIRTKKPPLYVYVKFQGWAYPMLNKDNVYEKINEAKHKYDIKIENNAII